MHKCGVPHGKVWIFSLSFRMDLWILTFSWKGNKLRFLFFLLHRMGTEAARWSLSLLTSYIFLRKELNAVSKLKIVQCLCICYSSESARCLIRYSSILKPGALNRTTDFIWNAFLQLLFLDKGTNWSKFNHFKTPLWKMYVLHILPSSHFLWEITTLTWIYLYVKNLHLYQLKTCMLYRNEFLPLTFEMQWTHTLEIVN